MDKYEKLYNEALERAKYVLHTVETAGCAMHKDLLTEIFPELRESEDERIRRTLVEYFGPKVQLDFVRGIPIQKIRDWLEKQKYDRMKPVYDARESFESALEKAWNDYHNGYENVDKLEDDYVECAHAKGFREGYLFGLEKQKEQKQTDLPAGFYYIDLNGNRYYSKEFRYGDMKLKVGEQKPIKVYRVENEDKQKGLWRKFDGTWEPLFDILTDGLCRDLPMEDSDLYHEGGKKWFASAPSRETLQKWFSKRDLEELTAAGFTISEFEVTNYKKVSEFEYIFTRDSIINRTYLTVSDIYPEQKPIHTAKEAWKEMRLEVYAQASGNRHEPNYSDDSTKMFSLCDIDEIFEKIGNSTVEQKPAEWSEDIIRKAVKEIGLTQHQIDWFKINVFPPKQEWSEEDEDMLNSCISSIEEAKENRYAYKETDGDTSYDHEIDWLKSLRPSWKPSEEQLNALNFAITYFMHETNYKNPTELRDLYDALLKLK